MPRLRLSYDESGPLVEFNVGVSGPMQAALRKAGRPVPPELPLMFIIDTGASKTMIFDQHMRSLGIDEKGHAEIVTASSDGAPVRCSTYDIHLTLRVRAAVQEPAFIIPALEVVGRPLFNSSIDGMIGRDVLNRLIFTMDGPHRSAVIEY